jgi:hypothetical protein
MKSLIQEISDFAAEVGLSDHRVGILLANNGRLIPRLKNGGRIWPETELEIRRNMAAERKKRLVTLTPSHDPALTADDAREVSCPVENVSAADAPFKGAGQ